VPAVQILVITVFEDDEKIFRAVCAGASGYLLKSASMEELAAAVAEVRRGGSPMTPRVARRVLEMFSRFAPKQNDYGLGPRERAVLELYVQGFTNKEVAEKLAISVHTVDSYNKSLYEKLHVNTRSGAVAKALKERLV
jgi:DNA-binding NarL/FixJ family response regulator